LYIFAVTFLKQGQLKNISIFIILVFFVFRSNSQEMFGLVSGNFAGVSGVMTNPSSMVNSKLYLDINFLTMDVFVHNNYLYVPSGNHNSWEIFRHQPTWPAAANGKYVLDYYTDKYKKNAYVNFRLNGPSAMLVYGDHAFAIHDAIRSVTSVRGIELPTAKFGYEGLYYTPQQNINYNTSNFRLAELTWGEVGFSYAYQYKIKNKDSWTAGISIRRLWGFDGSYLQGNTLNYLVANDSTVVVNKIDGQYGLIGRSNDDLTGIGTSGLAKGKGWGFDIGITYTKLKDYAKPSFGRINRPCKSIYRDYVYRIGVSLMDLGSIKYDIGSNFSLVSTTQDSVLMDPFYAIGDIEAFNSTLSNGIYHNPSRSFTGTGYKIGLPSAFCVQYDYHWKENWYLNATLIKDFNLYRYHVDRPTILAFIPRWEKRWFEVNVPFSLYDYRHPRMGLSLRLMNFTIGTEKLGMLFNFNDVTGADIYFSLKINFLKGKCPSVYKPYKLFDKKKKEDCNCPVKLDTEKNRWKHRAK
jgi:hypothetical protein